MYLVIDSLILTDDEKFKFVELIIKGIKHNNDNYNNPKFELLYRASRDGWSYKDLYIL